MMMDQLREFSVWYLDVDWKSMEWKQLVSMNDFRWKYGATPFSQLQVIVTISILYMISIFLLQNYMKDKKPLKLWLPSLLHNIFLTALSLVMFLGASYGAYLKLQSQGFWAGWVCEQDPNPIKGPLFFWSYIFYLSKFYELLDSYLIVLKKKPLIFLHVWHHFIMPYVCWAGLEGKWCLALWTSCFWNSFVHVLMYFYYTVSTFGYSPWWKKHLTALQIYQFVSGVLYTSVYYFYYLKDLKWIGFNGNSTSKFPENLLPFSFQQGCTGDLWAVFFMFFVNNSFLVLFSKWYFDNYSTSKKPSRRNGNGNVETSLNKVDKDLKEPKEISESSNSNINSPSNPKKND